MSLYIVDIHGELEGDYEIIKKYEEPTTKNLGVDCISRADAIKAMQDKAKKLTNEDTINGLCGAVAILFDLPSVTPQLSVPEVTALAEWTEKLTKASEDAYNKGYADGMKAQAEHESLCKEEREISKEKAIEILRADSISSYSVEDILSARDMAIKALKQEPILDKIRAEIEQEYTKFRNKSDMWNERACGLGMALEIIDKYKTEKEQKE